MKVKRNVKKQAVKEVKRLGDLKQEAEKHQDNIELIDKFLRDYRIGLVTGKKPGQAKVGKRKHHLLKLSMWFGKNFKDVNKEDIKRVVDNLMNDVYYYQKGVNLNKNPNCKKDKTSVSPYSNASKDEMFYILKKFFSWMLMDNEGYPKEVKWIPKLSTKKQDIENLTIAELKQLMLYAPSLIHKLIFQVLFDSGLRIGEFLKLRQCDCAKEGSTYVFGLRHEHSKTQGRQIYMLLDETNKILDEYFKMHKHDPQSTKPLFPFKQDNIYMIIKRAGLKVLKRKIHPHTFRHGSATYFCNHLSHAQLCQRYGWSMSSDMPAVYISRAGVMAKTIKKQYETSTVSEMREKLDNSELTNKALKNNVEELEKSIEMLNKKFEQITKASHEGGKDILLKIKSDQKYQEEISRVIKQGVKQAIKNSKL